MFSLSSPVVAALSRELDACALRHQVYSSNIANVDTQGYQRLEVLQAANVSGVQTSATPQQQIIATTDSVQLDQEMARLTRNALRYETLLTAYQQTSGIISLAIKEGRGS